MSRGLFQKFGCITLAFAATVSGFALVSLAKAATDLGGDCCAELEERVAELEATTIRHGNKKVSVVLSGWVIKMGAWWDDGHENGLYWGDGDTTLASHLQISGSAQLAQSWSAGYTISVETPGDSAAAGILENQFNDNAWVWSPATVNTVLSYMWIKNDQWGTVNWGQLNQATDNVGLVPDLSGTLLESNAVLFNGSGMLVRPHRAKNATDLTTDFTWLDVLTCLGGAGVGADCNGYPGNAFRYDSPTYRGFSVSSSYGEDDIWDVAVKYAAELGRFKVTAAYGFSAMTDEGCNAAGCTNIPFLGGGGSPFQGFEKEANIHQVGASALHSPSGIWAYGYYEHETNSGTKFVGPASDANDNDVWFIKTGIKRNWTPLGATVIWGEGGQYIDQFTGICGTPNVNPTCVASINAEPFDQEGNPTVQLVNVANSTVNRWGAGIVQEIDAAAMHLFFRWQEIELDMNARFVATGEKADINFENLNMWVVGGVLFF